MRLRLFKKRLKEILRVGKIMLQLNALDAPVHYNNSNSKNNRPVDYVRFKFVAYSILFLKK